MKIDLTGGAVDLTYGISRAVGEIRGQEVPTEKLYARAIESGAWHCVGAARSSIDTRVYYIRVEGGVSFLYNKITGELRLVSPVSIPSARTPQDLIDQGHTTIVASGVESLRQAKCIVANFIA